MGCCCSLDRGKRVKFFKYFFKSTRTPAFDNGPVLFQPRRAGLNISLRSPPSVNCPSNKAIETNLEVENYVKQNSPKYFDSSSGSYVSLENIKTFPYQGDIEHVVPPIYPKGVFEIKTEKGMFFVCNIHVKDDSRTTKDFLDVNKMNLHDVRPHIKNSHFLTEQMKVWREAQNLPSRRLHQKCKVNFKVTLKISQRFVGRKAVIMRCYSFIGKNVIHVLKATNWCLIHLKEFQHASCETGCNSILNKEDQISGICY